MDSSYIPQPYRYKEWLVWPDTVFDFIGESDCDDTINGVCITNRTIEECINECKNGCSAGYQIQFPDGRSICVPIYTELYPNLNPVYRLRKQSIYPQLDKVRVNTYVNTKIYSFPPDSANTVFYRDILSVENVATTYKISSVNDQPDSESPVFVSDKDSLNIQILPEKTFISSLTKYTPVKFGDNIKLSIPATSLLMQESDKQSGLVEWIIANDLADNSLLSFRILPVSSLKKHGDEVSYSDTFILQYMNSSIVAMDKNRKKIELVYDEIKDIRKERENDIVFTFNSKMTGYFCKDGLCSEVALESIDTDGVKGRYNGVMVGRDSNCWGTCSYSLEKGFPELGRKQSISLGNILVTLLILSIVCVTILSIIFITR
jgi:hypothetical protein